MKTTKIEKPEEFDCPTIVKIVDDYYVVSKKFYPNLFSNSNFQKACKKGGLIWGNPNERYIAINLNNGEWFDWGDHIPGFGIDEIDIFTKGTKFEIEI